MTLEEFKEKFEKVEVSEFPNTVPDNPLVSVQVQTYQQKDYVEQCLKGVLMQKTTFPYEVVLGDDDSTDGTREICIEYAKKYPDKIRLFLHHRENNVYKLGKPSEFFNITYNRLSTRGKYLATCDGDDYWIDPLKLQKQADILENNPDCMAVCTNFKKCDENGNIVSDYKYKFDGNPDVKINFKNLLNFKVITRTLTVMWRKDLEIIRQFCSMYDIPLGDKAMILLSTEKGYIQYLHDITAVFRGGTGYYTPERDKMGTYRKAVSWNKLYKHFNCTNLEQIIFIELHHEIVKLFRQKSFSLFFKNLFSDKRFHLSLKWFFILLFVDKLEIPAVNYIFNVDQS